MRTRGEPVLGAKTSPAMPVRLVHLTNAGGFGRVQRGGAERGVEELSTALSVTPGWEVSVVAPPEFLAGAELGVEVSRIALALDQFTLGRAVDPHGALQRILRQRRPTVVITHLLRAALVGLPATRLATPAGTICVLHNSLRDAVRHGGRSRRASVTNLLAFRSLGRLADAHVAISPSNAADLAQRDQMPAGRVHLIPNWVSPAFTDFRRPTRGEPVASGFPIASRVLLLAGRLEDQKQQTFAISLLPDLPASVVLAIVGEGTLERRLRREAAERQVADRVVFMGHRHDVPALMAAADLVLVPSRFEGFGRVAIESLAVGTPVLASNVAGLRDTLGDAPASAARLIAVEDRSGWLAAIRDRLARTQTPTEAALLREYARSRYSLDTSVALYRDLIASVARHA
jgi:glycosyltransferase involved in cell wall biosynthesis